MNNFLWLDFFTHKVIIFLNQHKISRPMVYNMTTFENFDEAKKFSALMGGFRATDHARNRDSRIFWNSMVYL